MLRLQVKQIYRRLYSSSPEYDVVFIGAGPGGYVGAIKAAQLGLRTACVEKRPTLGGTCLNVGCIPSKALLHNSHLFYEAKEHFSDRGIDFDGLKVNLERMLAQKDRSVKTLTSGIEFLFRKNKISHLFGQAKITSPNTVQITKGILICLSF